MVDARLTVLVTGAGMIGSCVAKELIDRGEKPVVLDSFPRPEYISDVVNSDEIHLVRGDVLDLSDVLHIIKQFEVDRIIHTAGILTVGAKEKPYASFKVNLEGTLNVLEACRLQDIKSVVFTSSSTVSSGVPPQLVSKPLEEDFPMRCLAHRPRSVYATTKLAAEYFGLNYADEYGLDFKVVRFAATYGPWRGPATANAQIVLANMVKGLLANGEFTLDPRFTWTGGTEFLFSLDAARGAVLASETQKVSERVFNIGVGKLYTLEEVLITMKSLIPKGRIRVPEIRKGMFGYPFEQSQPLDISSAKRELGYEPRFFLDSALEYLIKREKTWIESAN